ILLQPVGKNDTIYCGRKQNISRKDATLVNQLIEELSQKFYAQFSSRFPQITLNDYRAKFSKAILEGKNTLIIRSLSSDRKRWITYEDTAALSNLPLIRLNYMKPGQLGRVRRCVNISTETVRILPYGEMAKRLLGVKTDTVSYGLERAFDEVLYGALGSKNKVIVNEASIPLKTNVLPVDGKDIYTTLNLDIQNIVHNELTQKLRKEDAEWGCVVVMETKTGEIKAYSNLTRTEKGVYEETNNYAHNQMVEPGSTFKLASILAYLDCTPDDSVHRYPILKHTFDYRGGSYTKWDIEESKLEGLGYPIEAFQRSSNVGVASMILDKYPKFTNYLAKLDSLYITTSFATQLGQVKAPELPRKRQDFHTIYNTCFGTGFRMTILQTLVYFNAVANNGKMIAPLFVKEMVDLRGNHTTYKAEVLKEQICKPSTIQRARKYLEQVVYGKDGIAKRYKDSVVVTFAGKTGTRDVWDENAKQYLYDHNSVSFCGYFPADNPKYTCIVYMHNVTKKSGTAVSLFAKILNKISNHAYGKQVIPAQNGKKLPSFINVPADAYEAITLSLQMDSHTPLPATPYVSGTYKGRNFELKESQLSQNRNIPNVMGMSAIDATQALNRAGYKVLIQNRGKVQKQINNEERKTVTLILK
ncbi:MAG: hypothetical protein LBL18_04735, partial [Bacteroidales bacterium]|nr:hypothetical protein [Bacteroidales bacterium]